MSLFHLLLKREKRGALSKEDRKGGQGDVLHRKMYVPAPTNIGQRLGAFTKSMNNFIKPTRTHAQTNAGTDQKVQVTIVLRFRVKTAQLSLCRISTPLQIVSFSK